MATYQTDSNFNFNFKRIRNIILGIVAFLVFISFMSSTFITIDAGHKGVLFKKFSGGLDKENIYPQGFHIIAPWNTLFIYDVRKQQIEEVMDILSSNGLSITVDVSVIYRPLESKVGYLHDLVGIDFVSSIVIPEARSAVRQVMGRYTPEELYSSKREAVQKEIYDEAASVLEKNYVIIDAILIRSVKLPETIKTAIESKLKQEQESLEYEFRIQKAKKEADRLTIEAQGIQNFQKIVTEGITDKLLKWKGVEATQELAKSPNSKIIMIGSGANNLPVILSSDK